MKHARLSIVIASLGVATVLSGCNGSSSAGGLVGGVAGGGQDFETAFNAVSQKAPTSDMPTSLKASYEGQMKVGVNSGSAQIFGTDIDANSAEIIGDLAVDVDWTDGQTTNPFTGTASNIVATEAGTSNSVKLDGSSRASTSPSRTPARCCSTCPVGLAVARMKGTPPCSSAATSWGRVQNRCLDRYLAVSTM